MLRPCVPQSPAPSAHSSCVLTALSCSVFLSGCLVPIDRDPRLERIAEQLQAGANMVAAQRAAEVFDPGAPLVGGAALGNQRAAVGVRVVASNGYRPDLSTADANPAAVPGGGIGARGANSQTIVLDGAVRILPGLSVRSQRYSTLGLDGLARVASVTSSAPGDASNVLATGFGARLGLLTDREHRRNLSLSILRGSIPGASYESSFAPTAPATSAQAALRVDRINVTAVRLQGSVSGGEWGLTAGIGANSGRHVGNHLAQLTYADSVSSLDRHGRYSWKQSMVNIGITRRIQRAELTLQYGHAEAQTGASNATRLPWDTGPRRSVSLGAQVVY